MPSLDPQMLERLVCPETRQALKTAPADLVVRFNQESTAGSLKTRAGNMVHGVIEAALLRADGKCAFLVVDGVPNLLTDERIDL